MPMTGTRANRTAKRIHSVINYLFESNVYAYHFESIGSHYWLARRQKARSIYRKIKPLLAWLDRLFLSQGSSSRALSLRGLDGKNSFAGITPRGKCGFGRPWTADGQPAGLTSLCIYGAWTAWTAYSSYYKKIEMRDSKRRVFAGGK